MDAELLRFRTLGVKTLENGFFLAGRDAGTVVVYMDDDPAVFARSGDSNDTFAGAEGPGIGQQVAKYLG